ncbi:MAG: co-chaperone DjlA [Pseudomonadota bacterium]
MNVLGKVIGGLAGLVTGKWPVVLFGLLLGHQFDRGYAKYASARRPHVFVAVVFRLMGHLAKADGRVSEDEIRLARTAMHALDLDGDKTRQAMDWFNTGKDERYNAADDLAMLRGQALDPHAIGRQLVQLLLPILLIKDEASQQERRIIWQVCETFDISRVELAQIEAAIRIDRRFGGQRSQSGKPQGNEVDRAYTLLGLGPDASDQQIKTAYRRLTNRYHPDKLAGQVSDPAELDKASRKTREIREAYELLRTRRGFK